MPDRVCVGDGSAWMEALLIVATIAQRWQLELVSRDVTPHASITLGEERDPDAGGGREIAFSRLS